MFLDQIHWRVLGKHLGELFRILSPYFPKEPTWWTSIKHYSTSWNGLKSPTSIQPSYVKHSHVKSIAEYLMNPEKCSQWKPISMLMIYLPLPLSKKGCCNYLWPLSRPSSLFMENLASPYVSALYRWRNGGANNRTKTDHPWPACWYEQDDGCNYWQLHPTLPQSIEILGPNL